MAVEQPNRTGNVRIVAVCESYLSARRQEREPPDQEHLRRESVFREKIEDGVRDYQAKAEARGQTLGNLLSIRRGLDEAVANRALPSWCVQTLACRADDTPDFDHFTRAYVQWIEQQFKDRLLLWFSGFPMTGQVAVMGPKVRGQASPMVLETKLIWRADDSTTFDQASRLLEQALKIEPNDPKRWLKLWAQQQSDLAAALYDKASGSARENDSISPERWKFVERYDARLTPDRLERGSARPESPEPSQHQREGDDLFIATDDGIYLLRNPEYAWDPKSDTLASGEKMQFCPQAFFRRQQLSIPQNYADDAAGLALAEMQKMQRTAEKHLAARMINGGVSLAAIPSTGLPTRGTWCYLVHLPESESNFASAKGLTETRDPGELSG